MTDATHDEKTSDAGSNPYGKITPADDSSYVSGRANDIICDPKQRFSIRLVIAPFIVAEAASGTDCEEIETALEFAGVILTDWGRAFIHSQVQESTYESGPAPQQHAFDRADPNHGSQQGTS